MQWFLYFLYYAQAAQPVPSTKVQASSMTDNTILMTYQIKGAYVQVHETCYLGSDDNTYYWYGTTTTDGNWYYSMYKSST